MLGYIYLYLSLVALYSVPRVIIIHCIISVGRWLLLVRYVAVVLMLRILLRRRRWRYTVRLLSVTCSKLLLILLLLLVLWLVLIVLLLLVRWVSRSSTV